MNAHFPLYIDGQFESGAATFGSFGLSGHGREGGFSAALEYTTTKSVWLRTSDEPISDPFVMR